MRKQVCYCYTWSRVSFSRSLLRTSQLHFELCIVAQSVCDLRVEYCTQEDEDGHNIMNDVVLVTLL